MEIEKQSAPSTGQGGKDSNSVNEKSGSVDLYSFWNSFDPNEISPEPPPEQSINESKQEITDAQPNYSHRDSIPQMYPNATSNVGYPQVHRVTDQNELHKISSAIAASQLSSAVLRRSDSFQNRMNNQFNYPNIRSDNNVIRNSNACFHQKLA